MNVLYMYTNGNRRGQKAMKYGFIFSSKDKTGRVGGGGAGWFYGCMEGKECLHRARI
jgi:hypothetical protein